MQNQQYYSQHPTPAPAMAQQAPYVADDRFQQSALSQMRVLSIIQVTIGILSMTFGIVLVALPADTTTYGNISLNAGIARIGAGIWIGFYYIIVGAIGIGAVKSNTGCWIIVAMVLNIVSSALFFYVMLGISITGITFSAAVSCGLYSECDPRQKYYLAMNCLLLLLCIAEFIIAIWSAVLCCGAVCRCCKPVVRRQVIQYNTPVVNQPMQVGAYPQQQYVYQGQQPIGGYVVQQQQPAGQMVQPQAPPVYFQANP